jgi:hypothetical protein
VNGSYFPVAGDFNGNGATDVLWYGSGSSPDSIWWGKSVGGRGFKVGSVNVKGSGYFPFTGDFNAG